MSNIKLFESKRIRSNWDAEEEKWYFAIADTIAILTDSPNPQVYWRVLKKRLKAEGNETVTNCNALKMEAPDGKMRLTDVADTEQLLRLIVPTHINNQNKIEQQMIRSERRMSNKIFSSCGVFIISK